MKHYHFTPNVWISLIFSYFFSGPNDNVVIYFDGHGSRDLIIFPDRWLYSDEMAYVFSMMHKKKKFKKVKFVFMKKYYLFKKMIVENK